MIYFYLLYFGIARNEFTENDLVILLEQSRARNSFLGITGKLLHCEGTFIQLLEGSVEAVQEVYQSIKHDQRLVAIKLITEGPTDHRHFADWTMAFNDISLDDINELEECQHPAVADYFKSASAVDLLRLLAKV